MRYLLTAPLLVLLAACSGQEQAPEPTPASEAAVPAPVSAVKLPGKAEFNVPSQVRTDKVYQTKSGATRRKVVFELLEATPDQSEAAVTATLAQAGYKAGAPKAGKSGKYSVKYKKKKAANITATYYPKLAKKPANPAAKSMVALSWQTKKAPKKTDAGK